MLKHFLIKYNNRVEYVKLQAEDTIANVVIYCIQQGYNLSKVIVLESASAPVRKPLINFINSDNSDYILKGVTKS